MSYRLRLTRKGTIAVVILSFFLVAGLGYGIWYLTQTREQVGEEPSDAAECPCGGYNEGWCDANACAQNPSCTGTCSNGTLTSPCEGGFVQCSNTGSCLPASECPSQDGDGSPGHDCNSCIGSCGKSGCTVKCDSNTNPQDDCGFWATSYHCRGKSNSGCNEAFGQAYLGSSGQVRNGEAVQLNKNGQTVTVSTWCSTVQSDSNAPNGAFSVVYIGDGGETCLEGETSCINGLDWDCSNEPEPICGDGTTDEGEQCDDGNNNNSDSCDNQCNLTFCGNGSVNTGEQCDDGNNNNSDGCRNDCTLPICGDGILDSSEQCDPLLGSNSCEFGACKSDCTCPLEPAASCGDGNVDPGEQCDTAEAGNSCSLGACQSDCTCPSPNPVWTITKEGVSQCVSGKDVYAQVDYTITVKNLGTTAGKLDKIADTLDASVQTDWIMNETISAGGTVSGTVITWDLSGDGENVESQGELTFTYSLKVPTTGFGDLTNNVTGYPLDPDVDNFSTSATVTVACATPQTAIFDSTEAKIIASVGLILIGLGYISFGSFDGKFLDVLGGTVGAVKGGVKKNLSNDARLRRSRKDFEKGLDKSK